MVNKQITMTEETHISLTQNLKKFKKLVLDKQAKVQKIEDGLNKRQGIIAKKKKIYNEAVKPKLERDADVLKRLQAQVKHRKEQVVRMDGLVTEDRTTIESLHANCGQLKSIVQSKSAKLAQ